MRINSSRTNVRKKKSSWSVGVGVTLKESDFQKFYLISVRITYSEWKLIC
jgi:hypothetical protein